MLMAVSYIGATYWWEPYYCRLKFLCVANHPHVVIERFIDHGSFHDRIHSEVCCMGDRDLKWRQAKIEAQPDK